MTLNDSELAKWERDRCQGSPSELCESTTDNVGAEDEKDGEDIARMSPLGAELLTGRGEVKSLWSRHQGNKKRRH